MCPQSARMSNCSFFVQRSRKKVSVVNISVMNFSVVIGNRQKVFQHGSEVSINLIKSCFLMIELWTCGTCLCQVVPRHRDMFLLYRCYWVEVRSNMFSINNAAILILLLQQLKLVPTLEKWLGGTRYRKTGMLYIGRRRVAWKFR